MGSSDKSNESAYQAALVTEQRAIDGRQQSIDLLQRLIAQMGDDPLLVKTKENLTKILDNPEVITDEVFNNIMSKTGEILDTNYDQQVQEVLGAARAKGVSGPALQVTLQKAKQQRASAIAGAYRDAIISRAESGLKTNMDAITSATNLLQNLFSNQRVASEDLVNVLTSTIPAPFRNYGVDDVNPGVLSNGGAGGAPGGTWRSIDNGIAELNARTAPLGTVVGNEGALRAADNQQAELDAELRDVTAAQAARNAASLWNPDGTPKNPIRAPANAPQTPGIDSGLGTDPNKLNLGVDPNSGNYGVNPNSGYAGSGTAMINGKAYVLKDGMLTEVPIRSDTNYSLPLREGDYPTPTGYKDSVIQPAVDAASRESAIQASVAKAMDSFKNLGSTIPNNFAPSQPISTLAPINYGDKLGAAYGPAGTNYVEQTITTPDGGPIIAGGNAQEAARGADLVSRYGAANVIGTSSGFGVQTPTGKAAAGAPVRPGYAGAGTNYPTPTGAAASTNFTPAAPRTPAVDPYGGGYPTPTGSSSGNTNFTPAAPRTPGGTTTKYKYASDLPGYQTNVDPAAVEAYNQAKSPSEKLAAYKELQAASQAMRANNVAVKKKYNFV